VSNTTITAEKMNEFVTLDDGFVYYWPSGFAGGALSAYQLREIADELDRRNEAWQADINKYFEENKE
jgi:hypothetical protein